MFRQRRTKCCITSPPTTVWCLGKIDIVVSFIIISTIMILNMIRSDQMLGSDGHHNQSHRHLHIFNMIRSVERALNERRRALKLLQKETKRHSGAKVIVKKFPCLQRTCKKCVLRLSITLRTRTLTSWTLQRQTLTRKVRHSGWRNKFSEIQAKTKNSDKRVSMFRRELAHFDAVMREEFSKTFDRSLIFNFLKLDRFLNAFSIC